MRSWSRVADQFVRDFKYGARVFVRQPGFAAVSVLTLALGTGANIAIFTVLYNAVLRPLPYPEPDRLLRLERTVTTDERGPRVVGFDPKIVELARESRSFEALASYARQTFTLTGAGDADRIAGEIVSASYFSTLGVTPSMGRLFLDEEDRTPGLHPVAVVSESLWRSRLSGRLDVVGSLVHLNRVPLTIVGVVYSPEFVYALGPGDMMPDNRRFGVFWLPEESAASLLDLDGAFNDVSLRLLPDADEANVIEELDDLLARYGGTGAFARKDQQSNAFLDGELDQLGAMAQIIPPIFLAISAFLINMILSRLISLEREQIGLLKALGYGRVSVVAHYLKLVLAIAAAGILIGAVAGTWLGHGMTTLYSKFYSFPFLIFTSSPDIYVIAAGVTVIAAIVGALQAIRTAFSLPAAVAMRPPAPTVYRELLGGFFTRLKIFSQLTIMALRHLIRHPVRSMLTAVGIAFSVGLMSLALGTISSVDFMIEAVFFRTDRQDAGAGSARRRREVAGRAQGRALPDGAGAAHPRAIFPPAHHHRQAEGQRSQPRPRHRSPTRHSAGGRPCAGRPGGGDPRRPARRRGRGRVPRRPPPQARGAGDGDHPELHRFDGVHGDRCAGPGRPAGADAPK